MINLVAAKDTLALEGELTIHGVERVYSSIITWLEDSSESVLYIDLAQLSRIDSAGAAFLDQLRERARERSVQVSVVNAADTIQAAMDTFNTRSLTKVSPEPRVPFFERIGAATYRYWQSFLSVLYLISDSFYFSITSFVSRRGSRKGEFTNQCMLIGMNAFPIVALISFLIGFILALQSAAQLRQFGASIYVADLVAISMTREMGPIMTAILFAGRSGSSVAAEIATMVVTEETDALKAMGLKPVRYNLVPKIYAITLMMPLLTIASMVLGILGALMIGVSYLDIGIVPFYDQVIDALALKDVVTGLIKSIVFAWLIIMTAAAYGFRTRGGAADVGKTTTASVVTSIFLVILADSIMGLLFYFDPKSPI